MIFKVLFSLFKEAVGLRRRPSFITFFVTWRCNCRCIMCSIWKKRKSTELSPQEIGKIFKQFKGVDAVRISGGEPFMRKDLARVINIVDEKARPGVIHITTNGLLTADILQVIENVKTPRKIHLKVSIDSIKEENDRIRGVPGAYERAMETLRKLALLRKDKKFYLGVNQTIVDRESMKSYYRLSSELNKISVGVHPVFAYAPGTALYRGDYKKTSSEFRSFGKFSEKEIKIFLKKLFRDAGSYQNLSEILAKRYYLKGLYSRMVNKKKEPNPSCRALKSHLRILPNGDVPVCLYNSNLAGNLTKENYIKLKEGKKIKEYREWVRKCPGCWAGCEILVNALYSGDIIKKAPGLIFSKSLN